MRGNFFGSSWPSMLPIASSLGRQPRLCTLKRLFKSAAIEGLHKVVNCGYLKGSQRVLIVGGHEDHERHPGGRYRFQNIEAVNLRHLYIQKNEGWIMGTDRSHCLASVCAVAEDLDFGIVREHSPDLPARQRLVVDYQRANPPARGHMITASLRSRTRPAVSKGIS